MPGIAITPAATSDPFAVFESASLLVSAYPADDARPLAEKKPVVKACLNHMSEVWDLFKAASKREEARVREQVKDSFMQDQALQDHRELQTPGLTPSLGASMATGFGFTGMALAGEGHPAMTQPSELA